MTASLLAMALLGPALRAPARAQSADQTASTASESGHRPTKEALDHYERGRRWYLAGRYRDALVELKAALELDRDAPDLIYNVARVYENLNEYDEAIAYYQRYLERLPAGATDERDRTEKTVGRLQGAKHENTLSAVAHPPPPAATLHAGRADWAFWLTAGGALALFGGGAATGMFALKKNDRVRNFVVGQDGNLARRKDLADQAKRFALIADGLFIAGGVALTSAVLLFLLRDDESDVQKHSLRLSVNLTPQRAQLAVSGRF
jgi:tetratricopeptide (TPR) repeat protein